MWLNSQQIEKRSIRAVLIQPPFRWGVRTHIPYVGENEEGIGVKPPLGILSIATTLKEFSRHDVKIIDGNLQPIEQDKIVTEVLELQPDVVGLSAWTDFWFAAYRLGLKIKSELPDVHLVVGGPHVGIFPRETLSAPFVDSIIVGDGEVPFLYLCNLIANNEDECSFPGIHFKNSGYQSGSNAIYHENNLDALPIPDRTLLPIESYSSVLCKRSLITTMITSRGCPYRCNFCKLSFQKCISRSADNVIEEFRQIQRLGIKEVEIYDDTFTLSKQRIIDICEGLIHENIQLEWAIRDRVNKTDPRLLDLMYHAGCRRVHYGIESGVDHVLKRMRKGITTEQARKAVIAAKRTNMTVLTYFMLGNLDETIDDMNQTIDFALELNADFTTFSIAIPYPGTAMYDEALASGIIRRDFWKSFAVNPQKDFVIPQFIENHATIEELISLRNRAIRRFYYRPGYIYNQIKIVSNLREFIKKSKMALNLFLRTSG